MGVLAGWQPPFGLFVFAGICFAGSGMYSLLIIYTVWLCSLSGVSNVILFITTRHSFIKQIAMNRGGTRVLVTTQRVTVRDESGIELDGVKTDSSLHSPITPKSSYIASFDGSGNFIGGTKEQVSVTSQEQDNNDLEDAMSRKTGLRVTVMDV
jgi:hypothetical protein